MKTSIRQLVRDYFSSVITAIDTDELCQSLKADADGLTTDGDIKQIIEEEQESACKWLEQWEQYGRCGEEVWAASHAGEVASSDQAR